MNPRIPPNSEDSERGIMGAILHGSEDAIMAAQQVGLTSESFYIPSHRIIYAAAMELQAKARPVNLLTVCDALKQSGMIDHIGGRSYVECLVADCPTTSVADYCAAQVSEKEQARKLIDEARRTTERLYDGEDLSRVRSDHELAIRRVCPERSVYVSLADAAARTLDRWEQPRDERPITPTFPWEWLHFACGDLTDELIYLAAQPSIGKTAAATNIAVYNARRGMSVLFYSLESSTANLSKRFISHMAQVNCLRLRTGQGSIEHMQSARASVEEIRRLPIAVIDAPMTDAQLCASAKRMRAQGKCDLMIVDNMKHIQPSQRHNNEPERFKAVSEQIKWLRDAIRCPVLILHHLTDELKMAWSRDITRDADIIINMAKTDQPQDANPRRVEWIIEKNRDGIAGSKKEMAFQTDVQTFRS